MSVLNVSTSPASQLILLAIISVDEVDDENKY
jgi:hypothetical protein